MNEAMVLVRASLPAFLLFVAHVLSPQLLPHAAELS